MAATQKSVHTSVKEQERKMSLTEVIREFNEGRFKLVKIKYKKNDGYYVAFGPEMPKNYEILEVRPGLVVYRIGEGTRKAWKTQYGTRYRVPAKAKPQEGYAIAEIKGYLVYLHLA